MNSLIFRYAASKLTPLLLIFSIIVLLRGHNFPGGGFVGGLICASAFVLYFFGNGGEKAREALPLSPHLITSIGLMIAVFSGCFSMLVGKPFLSGVWTELQFFGFILKIGTPLVFDIGVYLTVLGATIMIFFYLKD